MATMGNKQPGNDKKAEVLDLKKYEEEDRAFLPGNLGLSDLPPLKRVGFWLVVAVATLIFGTTLLIFADYFLFNPLKNPMWNQVIVQCCSNDPVKALQVYRELQNMSLDRITRLFSLLVASTLFPILTSILGYLFGSRQIEDKKD